MKRRASTTGPFLERTAEQWAALGVHERYYGVYMLAPFLGWHRLASLGALRPDEVTRLRRIADSSEQTPVMDADRATRLLAAFPAH